MGEASDPGAQRIKVREVAGVFRAREPLEAAVEALLLAGFDRADIDLMAGIDAVRQRLGTVYVPAEDLADVPDAPRQAFVAREDMTGTLAGAAGILSFIGATAATFGVVASGGALAAAVAAAAAGGVATAGGAGALIARFLGREQAKELRTQMATGGLVLWVRVRSPEREDKAQRILKDHGAEAVRVHEIEIQKRFEDVPLSSLFLGEPD
jgi:hypothetical protein